MDYLPWISIFFPGLFVLIWKPGWNVFKIDFFLVDDGTIE